MKPRRGTPEDVRRLSAAVQTKTGCSLHDRDGYQR
nr:MAG TPA: hypothetical protein [Bacteriophage sp.]DAX11802.1 MAG TPA: hypothetical protein [Bacteriophage sp.]